MPLLMKTIRFLLFSLFLKNTFCWETKELFEKINKDMKKINSIGASIAWESSIDPNNPKLSRKAANYQRIKVNWQERVCDQIEDLRNQQLLNETQTRQAYLLCRGPKYTFEEARKANDLYRNLQSIYSDAKICLPVKQKPKTADEIETTILNFLTAVRKILKLENDSVVLAAKYATNFDSEQGDVMCLKGEAEFENLMRYSKNEKVLRFIWLAWRETIGRTIRKPYDQLVDIENRAARRNDYNNIGASWREEVETPNLRHICRQLYNDIRPLYALLHGVARFFLRKLHGDIVSANGPIPAHLLGDLWSQNWEPLVDLMSMDTIDLDESMKKLNWTVMHIVKRAEDFYQSLGLPPMRNQFWRNSVFNKSQDLDTRCHGTAADMFRDDDYRLLYCSGITAEDMYVIHHEMGHIQYFMAYKHQPIIYRQANTILHETIGDTIMLGVMTPQNLHRLGLINDSLLYNINDDDNDVDDQYTENNLEFEIVDKREDKISTKDNKAETRINKMKDFDDRKIIYDHYYLTDNFKLDNALENEKPYNNIIRNKRLGEKQKKFAYEAKDRFGNMIKTKNDRYIENTKILTDSNPTEDENKNKHKINTDLPKLKMTTAEILMFKLALNKIPQIPFALLIDEYRWKYFERNIDAKSANKEFWKMALELQGIMPPEPRSEEYFDVAAKFHVPDNTPYIRYFISSFLQHQLFQSLCSVSVYGARGIKEPLPHSFKLNTCDIYGAKSVGKVLKDIMSRGDSQPWQEIVQASIGTKVISGEALKSYYRPLYKLLVKFVKENRVPIGW